MIRDRSATYVEGLVKELIQLVTEDDKCTSVIKDMIHFDNIAFKEKDEMEDIFSSYLRKHPFDME
jgi:hypothetical protein